MPDKDQTKDAAAGLYHLSYYLPPKVITVEEIAADLDMPEERLGLYKKTHGLETVHVAEGETTGDIAVKAASKALRESNTDPGEIDFVILHHTLYTTTLQPVSLVGRIQHELGLECAIGFSIWEQNCASIITGLRVARNMLSTRSARTVLLVGADNYLGSKRRELEGITLLGDGSSAIIIKAGCETNRLIAISTFNEGSFYRGYYCDTPEKERFNLLYFLATTRIIQRTLHEAKLTMDDISVIIPHNINTSTWARILKILKCDEKKFFGDNIRHTGHVFGSDLVVNLADAVKKGRIARGEYALLVTAGLGAAWGCAIIQH